MSSYNLGFLRRSSIVLACALLAGLVSATEASAAACVQGSDFTYLSAANSSPVIIRFTNTTECDFALPAGLTTLGEVLVVGGGGGGGTDGGSGGGGGGVRTATNYALSGVTTLRITVGAGGVGGIWGGSGGTARNTTSGGSSRIRNTSNADLFVAGGGGAGNGWGGGSSASAGGTAGSAGSGGGTGVAGQVGGSGASGCNTSSVTLGGAPTGTFTSSSITGSSTDYGGGGGGGSAINTWNSSLRTYGRSGGGTSGGQGSSYGYALSGATIQGASRGAAGRANSGGGGGGGSACDAHSGYGSTFASNTTIDGVTYLAGSTVDGGAQRTNGGNGADGVVIISFSRISQTITFSSLSNRTMGTGTFSLSATASSGLTVAFTSATTSTCTVSGTTVTLVSAGTCTINANQAGDTNYAAATQVQQSFTISSALSITTPASGLTATYNSAYSLTVSATGGATPRTFALASGSLPTGLTLNTSTGVISGTPTQVTSSAVTVRATDANSATATTSSFTITVGKASQSALTITSNTVTYGETLTLTTSGGTGGGTVTYSKNSGNCTLSGTTLTTTAAGSCSVTATKATDTNYLETSTTTTITINTRPIRVKAADRSATYTGSAVSVSNSYSITSGTLASGESITSLTYTYTSIPSGTYNSTTAPTTAGSYTITPSAASFSSGNASNYAITYDTATLTINKASQSALTITSTTVTFGDTLTLTSSGGSGTGLVTFVKNSGNCTIATPTLSPTAVGSCSVTATKASDTNFLAESSTATTITISTRPIRVTAADRSATYTGSAVSISNSYSITSGSLASSDSITSLTYTYTSSGGYNSQTAPTAAGTYTITPSVAVFSPGLASNYAITYDTATLTINKASQTITFTAPTTKVFGSGTFSLTPSETSTSGLALTFASTTPATCSVSGITVTLIAAGSCTITADQEGDGNYLAALQLSRTFTISKAQPLLSSFSIATKTFGNAPFALTSPTVTGSIPGSFTYSSSNLSVATISTNNLTIVGGGSSTITALFTPTDTSNYESATITATLTVNRASQATLTITTLSVAFGDTLALDTSGGSGNGNVTFTKDSGPCTISNSTLTPTAVGSCIVIATKAFDTNYLAESSTATTITIVQGSPSATLTFSSTTLTFGITNTLTITASVAGKVRFSANGRVIKSCKERATSLSSPFVATCRYKPATRRPLTITATLTPTSSGFASRTTTSSTFLVQRRTGARG